MDVRLLGPLEVAGPGGRLAALPGAKLRSLVTLLALDAGSVLSSDQLIEWLYGDDLPTRPGNALALLVSKLRRAMGEVEDGGERLIVTRTPGYLLDLDRDRIDVHRFERLVAEGRRLAEDRPSEAAAHLRQALDLWRGDALVDVAYQDLASLERTPLEGLRLKAVEDRIDADLALGRQGEVVSELEHLTGNHPLRERLWGQLMVALYRCGRQADALRAYQQARRRLADELGLEPGPALRRLETAVLDQHPSLDPVPVTRHRAGRDGNLPLALTELVGRKQELADLRLLLGVHRLVTIVGPGGAGKTRLAIEVGRNMANQVADGVWLVELAPVDGPAVATTTAGVLGIDQTRAGGAGGLARALADRELLLVLDNCEHLVVDAARLVHELLTRCPGARVLATSREPLGVAGEHRFALPPLDIDAAVELFAERVEAAGGPPLLADQARRRDAYDVCARLDGLPLALELAASRAAHLDVAAIAARLDDRFRLLTGGLHTAEPRQQTMRAVVDWSWDLLDDRERLVFQRFSVFAGSASLDAAEDVCAGHGVDAADVAGLLARLADKSLVTVDRSGTTSRFVVLQTLADYGRRRLVEAGENDEVRSRHARWVAGMVARAGRALRDGGQLRALGRLVAELDNVRAAASWATTHDRGLALEIAGSLGWFGYMTDQAETVWTMLTTALPATPTAGERPLALAFAAALGRMSGHLEEAEAYGAEAEALVAAGVAAGVAGRTLAILALVDVQTGAVQPALSRLEQAGLCLTADDDRWWLGYLDVAHAVVALYDGRTSEAVDLLDRSVAVMRALGDDWMALMALIPRAYLAERQGQLEDAATALEEGVQGAARFAAATAGTPVRLPMVGIARARLALIRSAQGRHSEAVVLAGQALDEAGLGTSSAVAIAHQARGRALLGLGRREEGREDLERAVAIFHDLGVGIAVAESLVDLGRSWLEDGDLSAALSRLERAKEEALGTQDRHTTALALTALADAYAAAGDPAAAAAVRSELESGSG